MPAHDDVLAALTGVLERDRGEVRLLGRVSDPLIGNTVDREVFVFIPDLHLVSPARRAHFGAYGFNHEASQLLARLLGALATLQQRWVDADEHDLVAIQMGDFFDLWREFPDVYDPGAIPDEAHGALRDTLYRGVFRGKPCLEATILLGNHDTKGGQTLPNVRFNLKAFNRSPAPFLFATHGDAFDILERLAPDQIQEFIVYGAGSHTPVNKYPIGQWGGEAERTNKPLNQMRDSIVAPRHDLTTVRGAVLARAGAALPERLARVAERPEEIDHRYFQKFYEAIGAAVKQYPSAQGLRVVVIGHTHQAAMILCEPPDGGRPMLFIDAGAWIEQCTYHTEEDQQVTEGSAQLAVIHGNDARLYQIRVAAP
jgi:UDP-2,3-diacylglucosamine pyrophosphatase LpxH